MTPHVIIVAAGSGSRYGGTMPKQFCELSGRPVLMTTIDVFRNNLPEADILLVVAESMRPVWLSMCEMHGFESPAMVAGGESRSQSVANALAAVGGYDGDIVLIHDGARPLVDGDTIRRVTGTISCRDCDGVIPAVKVTDSIRRVAADGSSTAVDRTDLRAVQTPQAFRLGTLRDCYARCGEAQFTDDASLLEAMGHNAIVLVDGSVENIKITNPGDMEIAEQILSRRR